MEFSEFYKVTSEESEKESEMMQHKIRKDLTINFHGRKVHIEIRCVFELSGREHGESEFLKMLSDKSRHPCDPHQTIVC